MSDAERVADALKDVQRAYYCPPFDPYMIHGAVAFAVAAKEARLEHIVGMTQWLASPSHPSLMTRQHWLVDRLFSMTPGIAHTIVRPGIFADAYLATIGLAAHLGVLSAKRWRSFIRAALRRLGEGSSSRSQICRAKETTEIGRLNEERNRFCFRRSH